MKNCLYLAALLIVMSFYAPEKKVSFFMVGDSTMADKPLAGNPERGWGQLFPEYLTANVNVRNCAVNGRSTKSFIKEGRWDSVMKNVSKGDWVFIQFGHNDAKKEDSNRYAAPQTTYRQNLVKFVTEARAKGANPVLITPVMRRKFDATGKPEDTHGEYPGVVRAVAAAMNVPLIDLHQSSTKLLAELGPETSKNLFLWIEPRHYTAAPEGKKDDTHFSAYGAARIAALVCKEILEKKMPLTAYLKPSAHPGRYEFELPQVYTPHFRKDTLHITAFGAVNDGVTLNTVAINKAIAASNAAGGGVVNIPQGLWLTGPIVMKSNVELHTEKGAVVLFTDDRSAYPLVKSSFEGVNAARCQSPITAENLENIAITGPGIFHGSGHVWRPVKKTKLTETEWKRQLTFGGVLSEDKSTWYPSAGALKASLTGNIGKLTPGKELKDFEEIRDFLRPNMLRITDCKNVLLDGVTFENSPAWTMHVMVSREITIRNVTVKNPSYGQNTDALDLESCANILVDGCSFDTGDDGICIKSGRDEEGRKRGLPTENLVARNTTVYHAHGGFVIGSEMSGGARNLYVSNCSFIGTDIGLRFKTVRGRGGVVENIYASDIIMRDIPGEAISFDMYYAAKDPVPQAGEKRELPKIEVLPVTEATPVFRNFFINNVVCNGAEKGVFIRGIPEMNVSYVQMSNMVLKTRKAIECTEATGITFNNVKLVPTETDPVVYLQNSKEITFNKLSAAPGAALLFSVNGDRSAKIKVKGSDLSGAKQVSAFNFGALNQSLEIIK
ncbi:glycosyl hydrolase family 28 protein [Sediminibacterium ginsengisoli]|uniref:DNA sulfur modification protein DndE n=1 Tax=Sediminibacterium ginsengisoli TaxID=413434 RepID=A0A1T4K2T4_9BACT|nr:glycosyl hydrolase family 28 protein [Sediminibacterium ginsengisoli]SJZ36776.1 DNA sulfur modification protein DndE [Sediminibacterium ginsengisoli]